MCHLPAKSASAQIPPCRTAFTLARYFMAWGITRKEVFLRDRASECWQCEGDLATVIPCKISLVYPERGMLVASSGSSAQSLWARLVQILFAVLRTHARLSVSSAFTRFPNEIIQRNGKSEEAGVVADRVDLPFVGAQGHGFDLDLLTGAFRRGVIQGTQQACRSCIPDPGG